MKEIKIESISKVKLENKQNYNNQNKNKETRDFFEILKEKLKENEVETVLKRK